MSAPVGNGPRLWATSDIHVGYSENRAIVEAIRPTSPDDWLLVVGDIGERPTHVEWALRLLRERFALVAWVPGNHELWTMPKDPVTLRGEHRYLHLVDMCRRLGVLTPEDPYPVWDGPGGPATVAPLFLLYDYTFGRLPAETKEAALKRARREGIVCVDERHLYPDPHESRDDWCRTRVEMTEARLDACDPDIPKVLVNHWPLHPGPTHRLWYPVFALWCGTERSADWHQRYRTKTVVYGHLHIPITSFYDGVRFEEVSVGYPREWRRPRHPHSGRPHEVLRQILPQPEEA